MKKSAVDPDLVEAFKALLGGRETEQDNEAKRMLDILKGS